LLKFVFLNVKTEISFPNLVFVLSKYILVHALPTQLLGNLVHSGLKIRFKMDKINRRFNIQKTEIKAIFMGTRISDLPKTSKLLTFQMTDEGWPQFMRVSPILNWSYNQVWSFISDLDVPYCSLYDRGYTSIGSSLNTNQNPLLKFKSRKGEVFYLPAYMLKDEEHERSGRTK